MPAILLDVDGVLHVSGEPIRGAAAAVRELREAGHPLRFVTNATTRSRAQLAADLRQIGFDVGDDELHTTGGTAARVLAGRRVLALALPAVLADLEGVELVDDGADAVLVGGAGEGPETGDVFSYDRLVRAFSVLRDGAELYCLHRNRWWQTREGPRLDGGAFVAGLEYAAQVEATVLGKPSAAFFGAALDALGASPGDAWMIGDDLGADVRGAQACGLRAILVRTGKFREDDLARAQARPDAVLDSIAAAPSFFRETAAP